MGIGEILAAVAVSMLVIVSSVLIYFVYKRHREMQSRRQSRRAMAESLASHNLQDCPRPNEVHIQARSYISEPPLYEEVGHGRQLSDALTYLKLDNAPPLPPPPGHQRFLHPERSNINSSNCSKNYSDKAETFSKDNHGLTPCSTSNTMDLNIVFGSTRIYSNINNVPITGQANSTSDTYHLKTTVSPTSVVGASTNTSEGGSSTRHESRISKQEPHSTNNDCSRLKASQSESSVIHDQDASVNSRTRGMSS